MWSCAKYYRALSSLRENMEQSTDKKKLIKNRFLRTQTMCIPVYHVVFHMVKWPHIQILIWCNCWLFLCENMLLPLISSLLQFHSSRTLSTYRHKFTIDIKIFNQIYVRTYIHYMRMCLQIISYWWIIWDYL